MLTAIDPLRIQEMQAILDGLSQSSEPQGNRAQRRKGMHGTTIKKSAGKLKRVR